MPGLFDLVDGTLSLELVLMVASCASLGLTLQTAAEDSQLLCLVRASLNRKRGNGNRQSTDSRDECFRDDVLQRRL